MAHLSGEHKFHQNVMYSDSGSSYPLPFATSGLLIGENGTGIISGSITTGDVFDGLGQTTNYVSSITLANGTPNWTYTSPASGVQLNMATADGGAVIQEFNQDQTSHLTMLDSTGNPTVMPIKTSVTAGSPAPQALQAKMASAATPGAAINSRPQFPVLIAMKRAEIETRNRRFMHLTPQMSRQASRTRASRESAASVAAPLDSVASDTYLNSPQYFAQGNWPAGVSGSLAAFISLAPKTTLLYAFGNGNRQNGFTSEKPIFHMFMPTDIATNVPLETFENNLLTGIKKGSWRPAFMLREAAEDDVFLKDVTSVTDAVAFFGHSLGTPTCDPTQENYQLCVTLFGAGQPIQSLGLCFFTNCIEVKPIKGEPGYWADAPPGVDPAQGETVPPPGYAAIKQIDPIKTDAAIVFIASCKDGPVFQRLWGVTDNVTVGRAIVLPPNEEVDLSLGYRVWSSMVPLLIQGKTVSQALDAANAQNGTQWTVIGDHNVCIRPNCQLYH